MQPLYDFTAFIANKLSRRLGRLVHSTEVTISGIYPRADILGTLTKELVADVVYRGEHYYFNYDRQALLTCFDRVLDLAVGAVPASLETNADIMTYIADKTKIDLSLFTITNPTDKRILQLSSSDPRFSGKIPILRQGGLTSSPLHFWPLDNVYDNYGVSGIAMKDDFQFLEYNNKKWATLKNGASWGDMGIALTNGSDFTFQFELVIEQTTPNGTNVVFSDAKNTNYTWTYGTLYTGQDNNQIAMYGMFSDLNPALPKNGQYITTMSRSGNVWKRYTNGVLNYTGTVALGGRNWRYFGQFPYNRLKQYMRNLTYWDKTLSDVEVGINAGIL